MTTTADHGARPGTLLACPVRASDLYPTLVLALRDMRTAHGRDEETGAGTGNESWIGLTLGMIVLDTLSGNANEKVGKRWRRLLKQHGIPRRDADIIYALRNSLLHGYGPPKQVSGRRVILTPDQNAFAIDTSHAKKALISVPVFCRCLVERIASEAPNTWDVSEVDTNFEL